MKNKDMPAMPTQWSQNYGGSPPWVRNGDAGLTKLEYFAGLAMQGDWAAQDNEVGIFINNTPYDVYRHRAKEYIRAAKALLEELERTNED